LIFAYWFCILGPQWITFSVGGFLRISYIQDHVVFLEDRISLHSPNYIVNI
jgi:hypothetical protein